MLAFAKRQPMLYRASLKLRGVDLSYFVCRDTELLIAGYGGSANTYATYAILENCPNINLAHHLHVAAQVVKAAQLQTPCLVLARHPVDAISSLTTRNALEFSIEGLGWALLDYQNYYDSIVGCRDSFVSCGFRDVIEDYSAVIQKVNERFGTNLSVPVNGSDASKKIIATHKTPGTRRACVLEDVQAMLMNPALEQARKRAEQSYEEFCAATGTRIWKDPNRRPIARRE